MSDEPQIPELPYGGFSLFGVPYSRIGIDHATDHLKRVFGVGRDPNTATMTLIEYNENLVSRCGMLLQFSSIFIAILLYIASNPQLLTAAWQKFGFYFAMVIWLMSIIRLLWSLKHELLLPKHFNDTSDFEFTARLYLQRMGFYNIALVASIVSSCAMALLLLPISTQIADFVFRK